MLGSLSRPSLIASSYAIAYAGFSKAGGGGGREFENYGNQKKISPLGSSPFSCPKLGEDQNKKSLLKFSPVLAQN